MGTYGLLRALWRNWMSPTNPIYRLENQRAASRTVAANAWRFVRRIWRPVVALSGVTLSAVVAEVMCAGGRIPPLSLTRALISICSLIGGGALLLGLVILAYLWPLAVALNASGVIVTEREHQTWDVLLTTPFERADLVLAKLAASLNRFNPYGEMLLWVQSFLVVIVFALVVGQLVQHPDPAQPLVAISLLFLAMIEFAAARFQDYVLGGLIGLLASLLATTRQAAWVGALTAALTMILLRALFTTLILAAMPPRELPILAILFATGPSSAVVLSWSPLAAGVGLIAILLLREGLIRAMFAWLIRHLGETGLAAGL
jgi:hypothetical protein